MNNFCIVSDAKQSLDFVNNIWVGSFRGTAYENRQHCIINLKIDHRYILLNKTGANHKTNPDFELWQFFFVFLSHRLLMQHRGSILIKLTSVCSISHNTKMPSNL